MIGDSWDRMKPYQLDRTAAIGMSALGQVIRSWRRGAGLSQRLLADKVGLNQSTISRLENGLLRTFRLVNLARVIGVLHDPLRGAEPRRNRWT